MKIKVRLCDGKWNEIRFRAYASVHCARVYSVNTFSISLNELPEPTRLLLPTWNNRQSITHEARKLAEQHSLAIEKIFNVINCKQFSFN